MMKWIWTSILTYSILFHVDAQTLETSINELIQQASRRSQDIGISIRDVSSDQEIYQLNSDHFFIPASSLKLITTFSALDILGKNFTYDTEVYLTGKILTDGTLEGNIVINGNGDPSLGSDRFPGFPHIDDLDRKITEAIFKSGVRCIDGEIIMVGAQSDSEGILPGWPWNDVGNYYGAGAYNINYRENYYTLKLDRSKGINSHSSVAGIHPEVPDMSVESHITIDGPKTGDQAYIYGGDNTDHKIIRGTIPAGAGSFNIKGAMSRPWQVWASRLKQMLSKNHNIECQGIHYTTEWDIKGDRILSIKSPKLVDLVRKANEKSINLYCEAFLKGISQKSARDESLKKLYANLRNHTLDTTEIIMVDGSGLSSRNVLTPRFFTKFLNHYYRTWGDEFTKSLIPRASHQGTVRRLLKGRPSEGKAWLKSGYIEKVLSYTGIIRCKSGKSYSITIISNHHREKPAVIRKLVEDILDTVYLEG